MFRPKPIHLVFVLITIAQAIILTITAPLAHGQWIRRDLSKYRVYHDSIVTSENSIQHIEKSEAFYDSLRKPSKSKLWNLITSALLRGSKNGAEINPSPELDVSRAYFEQFSDRTINSITIVQNNVFETIDSLTHNSSKVEKFIDNLHIMVSEQKIRQNLLFKVGRKVQPYVMAINEQMLRNLPYLSMAYFVVTPDADDPSQVSVMVITRDVWAIGAELNWSDEFSYGSVFDDNFLGSGDRIFLKFYIPQRRQKIGFEAAYTLRNLAGTFADIKAELGVGQTNNAARIEVNKPIILPTDWLWGGTAGYLQKFDHVPVYDTIMSLRKDHYALWGGHAWNLEMAKGTTFYTAVKLEHTRFPIRPETTVHLNPFYYQRSAALMNIGVSRRNFFQGNMIYGYGRIEDIPYGHKFELVGGLEWSEFLGRRPYLGASIGWADEVPFGYLSAEINAGTYFKQKYLEQGMINLSLRQFSPLFNLGRHNYMREFLTLSGTWGLNRLIGEKELISYLREIGIHGLKTPYDLWGYNRMVIGTELVWFTPIFWYHFRFAFYIWGDIGWLGTDNNIFRNPMSSAAGIGLRIKNERLTFSNVQIRLGVLIKAPAGTSYDFHKIAWEQPLHNIQLSPGPPKVLIYE